MQRLLVKHVRTRTCCGFICFYTACSLSGWPGILSHCFASLWVACSGAGRGAWPSGGGGKVKSHPCFCQQLSLSLPTALRRWNESHVSLYPWEAGNNKALNLVKKKENECHQKMHSYGQLKRQKSYWETKARLRDFLFRELSCCKESERKWHPVLEIRSLSDKYF